MDVLASQAGPCPHRAFTLVIYKIIPDGLSVVKGVEHFKGFWRPGLNGDVGESQVLAFRSAGTLEATC